MSKEIYVVYVTYLSDVDQVYAFESKESAEAKYFELIREVEDDFYVAINKIILEKE